MTKKELIAHDKAIAQGRMSEEEGRKIRDQEEIDSLAQQVRNVIWFLDPTATSPKNRAKYLSRLRLSLVQHDVKKATPELVEQCAETLMELAKIWRSAENFMKELEGAD